MSSSNPTIIEIKEVKLFNTEDETEEQIRRIEFEGNNIAGHPDIEDRTNDGWIIQGMTARIQYEDALFDVTISGSDMMGYAKVADVGDYQKGQRLLNEVRGRFLEHFRR